MGINLKKLCVGISSVEQLYHYKKMRVETREANSKLLYPELTFHDTANFPKRSLELIESGSIYWIINSYMELRQKIFDIEKIHLTDGRKRCRLWFERDLILVEPRKHRPFQGWRYLEEEDAPLDIGVYNPDENSKTNDEELPDEISRHFDEMGVIR